MTFFCSFYSILCQKRNWPTCLSQALTLDGKDKISCHQSNHLHKQLESVVKAEAFAKERHRWNTNEEVASVLIAFEKHDEWQTREIVLRPPSGTMIIYNRKLVRYRRDGYCWKKRKDGKTTREDHMKLKVQGSECIYGCYVHSSILPTFHRRSYWLLQNPDVVLVHYLNVPLTRNARLHCLPPSSDEFRNWRSEDLELQIRPMFASLKHFSEDLTETSVQFLIDLLTQKGQVTMTTNVSPPKEPVEPTQSCLADEPEIGGGGGGVEEEVEDRRLEDFFSLQDFPTTCFEDDEVDEVRHESTSNVMDDLDDILSIVSASLRDDSGPTKMQNPAASEVENICMDACSLEIEFSPRWCYAEGGEKMLMTGKFDPCSEYAILFGDVAVRAVVVRDGVIKCTVPAHKEGNVELRVMSSTDSVVISCGTFQYKSNQKTHFHLQVAELVQILRGRMNLIRNQLHLLHDMAVMDRLLEVSRRLFSPPEHLDHLELLDPRAPDDLSLLHLASALGSVEMISILMMARNDVNFCEVIRSESDPMREDADGNIPIIWACARGNFDAFSLLFQACPLSMTSFNGQGQSPIHFIKRAGESFFQLPPRPCLRGMVNDKSTQTTLKSRGRTSDSKWPTDNDLCLPYRRSLQGQAPAIFGASSAKEYFREQCRKEASSSSSSSSSKFHNRSESLNEDVIDFRQERNFRTAVSEPLLLDEQISLQELNPVMLDSTSDLTDFSTIVDVDMEIMGSTDDLMCSEHMMTLANQIIAAIPERNKPRRRNVADCTEEESSIFQSFHHRFDSLPSLGSHSAGAEDSGIGTPMEGVYSLQEYRYNPTPSSTPSSISTRVTSPHPLGSPCATPDFTEYFNAPATYVEEDFSLLTLSDEEQKRLYEAARIIQNFYRSRKEEERSTRRQKEVEAAILIQNCYRRYKQFLFYKRMNQAAVLIQSRFRSYYAQKRFRRSREAATIIQNGYRAYKEKYKRGKISQSNIQQRLRNHYHATSVAKSPASVLKIIEATEGFSQRDPESSRSLVASKDGSQAL